MTRTCRCNANKHPGTGDHDNVVLEGAKTFCSDRCVFALQNMIPGDVLDRNNIIVKTRRFPDQECVAPIIYEKLVDGNGKALSMIKAGTQLSKHELMHSELHITDEETLRLGLGLVVTTEPGPLSGKNELAVLAVVDDSPAASLPLPNRNAECEGQRRIFAVSVISPHSLKPT